MSFYPAAPVSIQPEVTLVNWRIFETETGERHFVGYCSENQEGRVSSAIQQFDPTTRLGLTRSGRIYHLEGGPGDDHDGLYVWSLWVRINKIPDWRDVTEELVSNY